MEHTGTIPLETERLLLRRFTPDDAEEMFAAWAGDPEATRYLSWKAHDSAAATRRWLEHLAGEYEEPSFYGWAVTLRDTGRLIGDISVVRVDEDLRIAEIGWVLSRQEWGKGYAPEAGRRIIAHLFDVVGFHRIEARHNTQNPKSGRAMTKCGMRYEGTLRQTARNNEGGYADMAIYSILEGDARRKDPLWP